MPSFQKRTNGQWSVRFRVIISGKEIYKRLGGFPTKKAAQEAYLQFQKTYTPTFLSHVQNVTSYIFEDLLIKYFQQNAQETKESTQYDKTHNFSLYITPYFKNQDVRTISKAQLYDFQTRIWTLINPKSGTEYAWKYKIKIRSNLFNFLSWCEQVYDIPNQMKYVKTPKNTTQKKEIQFWNIHQFNQFIEFIRPIEYKTLFYTMFYSGARIGEILSLSENDYTGNSIRFTKNMTVKTLDGSQYKITATKNYKNRITEIPNILQVEINEFIIWKRQNKISSSFLFGNDKPLPMRTIRRYLEYGISQANLTPITPHGFRHSYVSLLVHLKTSTKTIAALIGDTEEQVIKTYSHLYYDDKISAIKELQNYSNQKI